MNHIGGLYFLYVSLKRTPNININLNIYIYIYMHSPIFKKEPYIHSPKAVIETLLHTEASKAFGLATSWGSEHEFTHPVHRLESLDFEPSRSVLERRR